MEYGSIPEDARCFYISHGSVIFRRTLPISEEPLPFIGLTILLAVPYLLLIFSVKSFEKKVKMSGKYGENSVRMKRNLLLVKILWFGVLIAFISGILGIV